MKRKKNSHLRLVYRHVNTRLIHVCAFPLHSDHRCVTRIQYDGIYFTLLVLSLIAALHLLFFLLFPFTLHENKGKISLCYAYVLSLNFLRLLAGYLSEKKSVVFGFIRRHIFLFFFFSPHILNVEEL